MYSQKSFINERPTLYLVATPIGNLQEMTPRAIEVLKNVDLIGAEDTRNTSKLLREFDINTKVVAHHNFNEKESSEGLLSLLLSGKNIAIVSDAGYPLIQDPGQSIVLKCIENNINVVPISGCNAGINALVCSGLKSEPYMFYGFLSNNNNESRKQLKDIAKVPCTIIFYEAPHRIERTLKNILEIFGNRKACLARELTKRYEEFIRGTIEELVDACQDLKGEMVLVVEGYEEVIDKDVIMANIEELVNEKVSLGMSVSQAIKEVAKQQNISKNDVYREYHKA